MVAAEKAMWGEILLTSLRFPQAARVASPLPLPPSSPSPPPPPSLSSFTRLFFIPFLHLLYVFLSPSPPPHHRHDSDISWSSSPHLRLLFFFSITSPLSGSAQCRIMHLSFFCSVLHCWVRR